MRSSILVKASVALISCVLAWTVAAAPAFAAPPRRAPSSGGLMSRLGITQAILPATANQLATAMDIPAADLISADIGTSDPTGVGIGNAALGRFFPRAGGTFAILGTGAVNVADTPNTSASTSGVLTGLNNSQGNDMVQLTLVLKPPQGAQCLSFDFAFYSEEFPEFVGSPFNDFFLAELGSSSFVINPDNTVTAPNNFARDPGGNIISINTVFGVSLLTQSTYDGGTTILRAVANVAGQPSVTVVLTVSDMSDNIYDSAVFLDNFAWLFTQNCSQGSTIGSLIVSPQSGFITPKETFDLTLFTTGPAVSGSVKVNGTVITPFILTCIFGTRHDTTGSTVRCPGVTGALLQSIFGAGPYTVEVTVNYAGGASQSETVIYDLLTFNTQDQIPLQFVVLPPSSLMATTQHFDIVLGIQGALSDVTGATATLDGANITSALAGCLLAHPIETLPGAFGVALRCPVSGGLFTPGIHVLNVSLSFGGSPQSSSVAWLVVSNTEP
jgi:hypothetical protein